MSAPRGWVRLRFQSPPDYKNVLVLLRDGDIQVARLEYVEDGDYGGENPPMLPFFEGTSGDGGDLNDLTNPILFWRHLPSLPEDFKPLKKPAWRPRGVALRRAVAP